MQIPRAITYAVLLGALTGFSVQLNAQTRDAPAAPGATPDAAPATDTQSRSIGQAVDDATITTKVKAALVNDDLVKARNIDVDTRRGVVWLNGSVASDAESEQAARLARQVDGVRAVQSRLTVGGSAATGSSASPESSPSGQSPEERRRQ